MRAAFGLTVHTGRAECVVIAGTDAAAPVEAREEMALLDEADRFVFHRAARMDAAAAERWVAQARATVVRRASPALQRLARGRESACAIVAKPGALPPLAQILASHLRIHAAEGLFYRDALRQAAEACGFATRVLAKTELDAEDARLEAVGRALGKPWTMDWKLATVAAWRALD